MTDPKQTDTYQIPLAEAREDDSIWTEFEADLNGTIIESDDREPVWGATCPQPDCGERVVFQGDPEDFANRPYTCPRCHWVSLMHASVAEIDVEDDGLRADGGLPTEVAIRESSWDDWIVVECPQCLEPMHLGEYWKEIILEDTDGTDQIPACPDCTTERGDQWSEDAEPMLDGIEFHVLAGNVIETRSPWLDDGQQPGDSP